MRAQALSEEGGATQHRQVREGERAHTTVVERCRILQLRGRWSRREAPGDEHQHPALLKPHYRIRNQSHNRGTAIHNHSEESPFWLRKVGAQSSWRKLEMIAMAGVVGLQAAGIKSDKFS